MSAESQLRTLGRRHHVSFPHRGRLNLRLLCPLSVSQLRYAATDMGAKESRPAAACLPSDIDVWRRWADKVSGVTVSCGHLIPEHAAREVVEAVLSFLKAATARDLSFTHPTA